jgi:subtilisin family serine protease
MICLLSLILQLSHIPSVLKVSIIQNPVFLNHEVRGIVQSGYMDVEPFTKAGLNGINEVVGIADSGINDLSCFFIDKENYETGAYSKLTTNRTGIVEQNRRKIIQYVPFADSIDGFGGHGTHIAATLAGDSSSCFKAMNGIASKAKISFFDIGDTDSGFLKIPPLHEVFSTAQKAGASIHSNSWGSYSMLYSPAAQDVDAYTFENPDFLVVFAAGNGGSTGLYTIITPGNAKNVLSVGSSQTRDVFEDRIFSHTDTTLAYFSSHGPTIDGRIKPDIIAPGDYLSKFT